MTILQPPLGLTMHIVRNGRKSEIEAMYCPPSLQADNKYLELDLDEVHTVTPLVN
jgi:hypothetical protein